MIIQEQLHETERALRFSYPPSFVSGVEVLSKLLTSDGFHLAFSGNAHLLLSPVEITAARESIPDAYIPFMIIEEQPWWPHIYAIDLDDNPLVFRVVVWSDHAVVMVWENFSDFIHWVHEQITKHNSPAN